MQVSEDETAYMESAAAAEQADDPAGMGAAAVDPGAAPEAGAATDDTAPAEDGPDTAAPEPRLVPYGALHEERERRKELQAEVAALRDKWARADERLQQIVGALQQGGRAPQDPAVPSYDEDPVGHLRARLDSIEQQASRAGAMSRQQADEARLQTAVTTAEDGFRQETPDYDAALQFVRQKRLEEFQAMGYAPAAAHQLMTQEARAIAIDALRAGDNPARRVYALARLRGYSAPAAGPGTESPVTRLAAAQEAAGPSLSTAGSGPRSQLTIEELGRLSDEAFDRHFAALWGRT